MNEEKLIEAMARGLCDLRISQTDEHWQRYRQPDSWMLFRQDATAALAAYRNATGDDLK